MRAVGIESERVMVTKLESGRRTFVRMDKLLALCVVLEMSPADLLVPANLDEDRSDRVVRKATARVE
jgi:DNA-binding Xre family transcriptional regulator